MQAFRILKTFNSFDFARVCSTPIVDIGIANPEEQWAGDFPTLAKKCRNEVIDPDTNEIRDRWIGIGNNLAKSFRIMTPEIMAIAICKIAGWKALLRDIEPNEDQVD